jgi:hypothetical protein
MDMLSGLAIFLLGASAGSILRFFQDRKLVQLYRQEAQRAVQALLEITNAYDGQPVKKSALTAAAPESRPSVSSGSLRSA